MPIVANETAPEIPWRPGYRTFTLAGPAQGMSCISSMSVVEPGSGAPLHIHPSCDEIILLMEGQLSLRLGDECQTISGQQTISIPAGTPHGFEVIGPTPARFYAFIQKLGAISAAIYLEGEPPLGAHLR